MFVNIVFVNPLSDKKEEVIERMHTLRKKIAHGTGFLGSHVLMEKKGKSLIGISMWKDEESSKLAIARILGHLLRSHLGIRMCPTPAEGLKNPKEPDSFLSKSRLKSRLSGPFLEFFRRQEPVFE
jgi:hypothetical protein